MKNKTYNFYTNSVLLNNYKKTGRNTGAIKIKNVNKC
ncbi:hypothetical protein EV144_101698 [Flavobacterium sp. 270]|nr:hypothetical protein EV144_101698 [Flavobacterium sp. 270]